MGCPACKTDYEGLETRIDRGDISTEDQLFSQDIAKDLFLTPGGLVIYCPACREKLQSLKDRIASRLRKETLANIGDLLDRASSLRNLVKEKKA